MEKKSKRLAPDQITEIYDYYFILLQSYCNYYRNINNC